MRMHFASRVQKVYDTSRCIKFRRYAYEQNASTENAGGAFEIGGGVFSTKRKRFFINILYSFYLGAEIKVSACMIIAVTVALRLCGERRANLVSIVCTRERDANANRKRVYSAGTCRRKDFSSLYRPTSGIQPSA